ncbi:MAG: ankyrin repeat domain-containing protein [Chitinophagaceae bacterium]|nr:ankyrin repeat domain-containing protein [Chitinophagaceae bacterium]
MKNFLMLFAFIIMGSCSYSSTDEPPLYSSSTFEGKYKEVAEKIISEDTIALRQIIKENNLDVNHKDKTHGISLLTYSLSNRKSKSCKKLLDLGANPNQMDDKKELVPAITIAASIKESSDYLKMLLQYGADPNIVSNKLDEVIYTKSTPLNAAVVASLENTKLLLENGANVNFAPKEELLPLTTALTFKQIDVANYLILKKEADVNKVIVISANKDTLRISELLRLNAFPLESQEYVYKMEIVDYLKNKGIDYRKAEIPEYYYDNFSKDYLEKY